MNKPKNGFEPHKVADRLHSFHPAWPALMKRCEQYLGLTQKPLLLKHFTVLVFRTITMRCRRLNDCLIKETGTIVEKCCNVEQTIALRLYPALAVLILLSGVNFTPIGVLYAAESLPEYSQFQSSETELTQQFLKTQRLEPGEFLFGILNIEWGSIQAQIAAVEGSVESENGQQVYLKASNTDAGDSFGSSVAISGDTLVVGVPFEDSKATGINGDQGDNSAEGAGAAYVFVRNGTIWSQQAYLKASNASSGIFSGDGFGNSVAISGDTLVIGAFSEDSVATGVNGDQNNNSADGAGAAYVFTRNGNVWNQQAYLKASNTGADDRFGEAVAISNDTIVVSALREDSNATGVNGDQNNNSAISSGAAYVFTRDGTVWSQQAYLKSSNTEAEDHFGHSVTLSGNILVVNASQEASNATGINGDQSDNSAAGAGASYVFVRNGTEWSQQAYLKASNTASNDSFGRSMTISGDTLVAGAPREDSNAMGINGDQSDNSADNAGAAYVFTRNGTVWSQQAYLKASNIGENDRFGQSVAISGDRLVVGAWFEDSNATGVNGDQSDNSANDAGAAYVFARNGTVWSQQAYLKSSNSEAGDRFGESGAIFGDTLLVGAIREASNATGINGDQSDNSAGSAGAAYVFTGSSEAENFTINSGLNDAWFFKDTAGQGFFIIVFPDLGIVFLAWFTFETSLPDESIVANLGWAGHRWFTAVGPYSGDTAVLDVEFTSEGVFDSQEPKPKQVPGGGIITVKFDDCENGTVTYDIPSIARMDVVPISRIVPDNVALCQKLSTN